MGDETIPPRFRIPQPFFKSPSCPIASGEAILIPKDSPGPVHLEGELVIVIDKKACEVPRERGPLDYVDGVTCGNDVGGHHWQNDSEGKDVPWWREGADTFGPVGPYFATGLDYNGLVLPPRGIMAGRSSRSGRAGSSMTSPLP